MKALSPEALAVLSSDVTVDGLRVTIDRPLDRKLYVEVNEALGALGGAWNRKAKAHVFTEPPAEALDRVLCDGAFTDAKRDLNQFFTPEPLAERIADLAHIKPGDHVLEPSAGGGALVFAAIARGASVVAVEQDEKLAARLKNAPTGEGRLAVRCGDFLTVRPESLAPWNGADAILMNPPFSMGRDVLHVTHALSFLGRGGRLYAIVAAGVTFREDRRTRDFRALVTSRGGTIEKLPERSFRESGTDVHTALVIIDPRRS